MNRALLPLLLFAALPVAACGSSDQDLIGQAGGGGASEGGASQGGMAAGGASEGGASQGGMGGSSAGTMSGSPSGTPTGGGGLACGPTVAWAAAWETLEGELLTLINDRRQAGGTCGSDTHASMGPLTIDPIIRDVARAHAEDMALSDYFSWTSPDGGSWLGQFTNCGYNGSWAAGGLTAGSPAAQQAFDNFVSDPTICNSMHANADAIGIGHYQGGTYGTYWVLQVGNGG